MSTQVPKMLHMSCMLACACRPFMRLPACISAHSATLAELTLPCAGAQCPPTQVPKMLGLLRRQWAPEAVVVSFKLETDTDILVSKVRGHLPQHHWAAADGT